MTNDIDYTGAQTNVSNYAQGLGARLSYLEALVQKITGGNLDATQLKAVNDRITEVDKKIATLKSRVILRGKITNKMGQEHVPLSSYNKKIKELEKRLLGLEIAAIKKPAAKKK